MRSESLSELGSPGALFPRRALQVFTGLGVLSLSAMVWVLLTDDPLDRVDSRAQDTFSRSAIGHHGAMTWLGEHGHPVNRSTYHTARALAQDPALLVLIEPLLVEDQEVKRKRVVSMKAAMAQAPATLIVLPKWQIDFQASAPEDFSTAQARSWIPGATRAEASLKTHALARINVAARSVVSDVPLTTQGWQLSPGLKATPSLTYMQLLAPGTGLEPLIWREEGILLGRTAHPVTKKPVFVLSDPDLLSNHGLEEGENAQVVLEMFEAILRPAAGTGLILIDETTHGYFIPPTLIQHMRRRPLLYVSVHLGLLALFFLWAGIFRFGRPRSRPVSQATGTHYLLEHTAELMTLAGDPRHSVEHYVIQTIREVAKRLHAPKHLSLEALVDWLELTAAERGSTQHSVRAILELAQDGRAAGGSKDRAAILPAVRISQWKRSILP